MNESFQEEKVCSFKWIVGECDSARGQMRHSCFVGHVTGSVSVCCLPESHCRGWCRQGFRRPGSPSGRAASCPESLSHVGSESLSHRGPELWSLPFLSITFILLHTIVSHIPENLQTERNLCVLYAIVTKIYVRILKKKNIVHVATPCTASADLFVWPAWNETRPWQVSLRVCRAHVHFKVHLVKTTLHCV